MKIEMIQPRLPTEQEIESEIKRLRDKARYRNALAGTICILIFLSVILIVCKIVIISAELFMLHQQQTHVNVMPILSCRLVIWGLLMIILYVAVSGMKTINKMIQKNRILEMQESQYRYMQKHINMSEKARRDFRREILTLAELYDEGKTDEVGKYLKQYVDAMPKKEQVTFCRNTALNTMLNYYVHVASLHKIDARLQVRIPNDLPVSDADLCSMVGNILENAVAACQSSTEKSIRLTIIAEDQMQLYIVVVNSFDGNVCQRDGRYISTKSDGDGIGLVSVAAIAEKYGGMAQFSHEGKLFYSNIAIPLCK